VLPPTGGDSEPGRRYSEPDFPGASIIILLFSFCSGTRLSYLTDLSSLLPVGAVGGSFCKNSSTCLTEEIGYFHSMWIAGSRQILYLNDQ